MGSVLLMSQASRWAKARVTNTTDNGFPSRVPRTTRPSGIGDNAAQATASAVIDTSALQADFPTQNVIRTAFFGVGSNNNTFSARLILWDFLAPANGETGVGLWVPVPIFEVQVTLTSSMPGVAGSVVDATNLFADTITLTGTTATSDGSINIVSPANDTIAHAVWDYKAGQLLEWIFTTGGVATSCNALWKTY